jgi:hypothetical protein
MRLTRGWGGTSCRSRDTAATRGSASLWWVRRPGVADLVRDPAFTAQRYLGEPLIPLLVDKSGSGSVAMTRSSRDPLPREAVGFRGVVRAV